MLSQTHIDAINIPEVHDENERGERPVQNLERAEAREFGRLLQDNVGIEAIVNRVTVHNNLQTQTNWIKETFYDYDIENLILVGGEASRIDYPGPSVNAASEFIIPANLSSFPYLDELEINANWDIQGYLHDYLVVEFSI